MIKEVSGDILLSKAAAIAHGIAPHDDFRQGLALALREEWPAMYKDFRHYCQTHNPQPGSLWSWKGAGSAVLINLFTQEPPDSHQSRPGKATVSNVNHVLHALKKEVHERKLKSLAMTRLATGVGGLTWEEVKPLIDGTLKDLGIPVYVYTTYKKGMAAQEL